MAWILEYQPKILLPKVGYVPFSPFDYQQEVLQAKDDFRAVNKSRQIGFTTLFAAEIAWKATHTPGSQIVIVSKNLSAARNFHKYVQALLYSAKEVDPDFPEITRDNTMETEFAELGSRIVSLPASRETGRSFSASDVYFDEIDHTPYARDIFQAIAPTIAQTGGKMTVFSSPKGRGNMMANLCTNPDELGFRVFTYQWWHNPVYNPHYSEFKEAKTEKERLEAIAKARTAPWYKKTRPKYSALAWSQEFECSFDADLDTVYTQKQLDNVFYSREAVDAKDFNQYFKSYEGLASIHWQKPKVEGHHYATGIDFGRKRDATVIITYDITLVPAEMVEYIRIDGGTSDWESILLTVKNTYAYYKGEVRADATGLGDVIFASIEDFAEPVIISSNQYNKQKYNLIENTRRAYDYKVVKMPKIPQLYSEHQKYTWDDKMIVQDSVIANAIAISVFYDPETEGMFVGVDKSFNYVEAQ